MNFVGIGVVLSSLKQIRQVMRPTNTGQLYYLIAILIVILLLTILRFT